MRYIQLILFFLFLNPGEVIFAQNRYGTDIPDKPLRIEIPVRSSNETYRIITCGETGFLIFFRSIEVAAAKNVNWYFSLYDTNMQQVWVKSIPLPDDHDFRLQQSVPDTLALLFGTGDKPHNSENRFEIVQVLLNKGIFIVNKGSLKENAVVSAFGIRSGRAWLGINIKESAGSILNFRLKQGAKNVFPLGIGSQISVRWMSTLDNPNEILAIVSRQISKKGTENYLVRYDTSGVIKSEILIGTLTGDKELKHFQMITENQGEYLLFGSYLQVEPNSSRKNKNPDESTGFFISTVKNGAQKSINFYNFLEFQNAGSLVGQRDMMELKKKASKKNKNLSEYSLDFPVVMHNISRFNDQYLMAAEVYAPQYRTENYTDYDYYGRPFTNSYSVFEGYRFDDAVIAGFDLNGKLIWDNTIEIMNLVSLELSPKVVVFPAGDDHVICYLTDGKVGSKIIRQNKVVEKLDFTPMELMYPEDKLLSENKGRVVAWYDNYLLSYGYQEIKNIALESNNKRQVFYFSKLRFD